MLRLEDNFYPDYIIRLKNGEMWIIETKGGAAADGTSANIDTYAAQKFDALKEYGEKHPKIKWGFVRNLGAQLYISITEWDENLFNHDVWRPIKSVIKSGTQYQVPEDELLMVAEEKKIVSKDCF